LVGASSIQLTFWTNGQSEQRSKAPANIAGPRGRQWQDGRKTAAEREAVAEMSDALPAASATAEVISGYPSNPKSDPG
jgi:hypothetical protein